MNIIIVIIFRSIFTAEYHIFRKYFSLADRYDIFMKYVHLLLRLFLINNNNILLTTLSKMKTT